MKSNVITCVYVGDQKSQSRHKRLIVVTNTFVSNIDVTEDVRYHRFTVFLGHRPAKPLQINPRISLQFKEMVLMISFILTNWQGE